MAAHPCHRHGDEQFLDVDEFVTKFAARARDVPAGDPTKNAPCVIGPMDAPSVQQYPV